MTDSTTLALAARILARAAALDTSIPPPSGSTVAAWAEHLHGVTAAEADAAVAAHYRATSARLTVAGLLALIRAAREDQARRAAVPTGRRATPEEAARHRELVREILPGGLADSLAMSDPDLATPCPFCHARPGTRCTRATHATANGGVARIATSTHPSRRGGEASEESRRRAREILAVASFERGVTPDEITTREPDRADTGS